MQIKLINYLILYPTWMSDVMRRNPKATIHPNTNHIWTTLNILLEACQELSAPDDLHSESHHEFEEVGPFANARPVHQLLFEFYGGKQILMDTKNDEEFKKG